jgi:hypothetical protein
MFWASNRAPNLRIARLSEITCFPTDPFRVRTASATAVVAGKPTFAGACADGEVAPIPAVQRKSVNLPGMRGGWTSLSPPSDSQQASDFDHSRASFFSPSVSQLTLLKNIFVFYQPRIGATKSGGRRYKVKPSG